MTSVGNVAIFYTLLLIFSLIVGSFLNVVIYRLPLMIKALFREECEFLLKNQPFSESSSNLNLFWPRSFCPHCHHLIRAIHNIPVFSYCFRKGRCYDCKAPISIQYPLVEILSAFFAVLAALVFGFNEMAIYVTLFSWVLLVLFFIDIEHQILPDSLTIGLLWIGLFANRHELFAQLPDAILGAIIGWLSLWLLIQIYFLITGKIGMGNGDFKLMAAFGAWFGWQGLPYILFLASFIGAIVGAIYLKYTKQSKETPIPFGPFLCISALFYLYGDELLLGRFIRLFWQ